MGAAWSVEHEPLDDGWALDLKANILLDMGELTWALEEINKAVYTARRSNRAWLTKGIIHKELGQTDRARFALDRFLELNPKSRRADRARRLLGSL